MAANEAVAAVDRVTEKLASMNEDPESIDKRTMAQLEKLEEAIAAEVERHRAARAEARAHAITVSNVSKASGISRATFYNKPLLRRYVDASRKSCGIDDEEAELERLREALAEKNRAVEGMIARDAELVVLAMENKRLRHKVETLEKYITDMPNDIRAELEAWGLEPSGLGFAPLGSTGEANRVGRLRFPEDEL